jgi:hypothetical protein
MRVDQSLAAAVRDELDTVKRSNLGCLRHDEDRKASPIPPRRLDWASGGGGSAFWGPPRDPTRAARMRARCGRVRRELN